MNVCRSGGWTRAKVSCPLANCLESVIKIRKCENEHELLFEKYLYLYGFFISFYVDWMTWTNGILFVYVSSLHLAFFF